MSHKIYYLPSYPFGERIIAFFRQEFSNFTWETLLPNQVITDAIIVADSNAMAKHPKLSLRNSAVLVINPIWYKTSAEPVWFSVPFIRNSFLQRLRRFRSTSLIDSYLYPHTKHHLKEILKRDLDKIETWYKLLKAEKKPLLLQNNEAKNQFFLITNLEDPLRDVDRQNSMVIYKKIWQWPDLSHCILAITEKQRLELKQILFSLTQDKGL